MAGDVKRLSGIPSFWIIVSNLQVPKKVINELNDLLREAQFTIAKQSYDGCGTIIQHKSKSATTLFLLQNGDFMAKHRLKLMDYHHNVKSTRPYIQW